MSMEVFFLFLRRSHTFLTSDLAAKKGRLRPSHFGVYRKIHGLVNTRHKQTWENETLCRMSLIGWAIIPMFVSALNKTVVLHF